MHLGLIQSVHRLVPHSAPGAALTDTPTGTVGVGADGDAAGGRGGAGLMQHRDVTRPTARQAVDEELETRSLTAATACPVGWSACAGISARPAGSRGR